MRETDAANLFGSGHASLAILPKEMPNIHIGLYEIKPKRNN